MIQHHNAVSIPKTVGNHVNVLTNQWGHSDTKADFTFRAKIFFQRFISAYDQNCTTLSESSKEYNNMDSTDLCAWKKITSLSLLCFSKQCFVVFQDTGLVHI